MENIKNTKNLVKHKSEFFYNRFFKQNIGQYRLETSYRSGSQFFFEVKKIFLSQFATIALQKSVYF